MIDSEANKESVKIRLHEKRGETRDETVDHQKCRN